MIIIVIFVIIVIIHDIYVYGFYLSIHCYYWGMLD